jgi:cytochrome c oxidase assembly protein subunit 15
MKIKNIIIIWLNVSIAFLFLIIIIGGMTRLTDSGLSMVTWKPITGVFPPIGIEQWEESFNQYKSFPEYKIINYNISLSEYKHIYYWEYLHRLLGRMIGVLFLIPFLYFLYSSYLDKKLIKKLLIVFFIGGFQGFLGWYMVKSGLVDIPHVSHYRLAIHLSMAFFILSYIYNLKLSLIITKLSKDYNYKFYDRFISIILILLFIQIIYGAFNAGLKTVNTVNTFPFYNGLIFPFSNISLSPVWLNFFKNHYGVQFIHRFLGLIIMGLIMIFTYKSNKINNRIKLESQYLIVLILFQCIVGILTLISNASIVFALLHQFLAILIILFTIKIKHNLKYRK